MSILKKKPRAVAKAVNLDMGDGETAVINLVKPTIGDRMRLAEQSKLAGDLNEKNEPRSEFAMARMGARAMVMLCQTPDGKPAFDAGDVEGLLDAPFFVALLQELGPVLAGEASPS